MRLCVKVLFIKIRILPGKKPKKAKGMSAKKAEKIKRKMAKKAEKKRIADAEKKKKKAEKKESGEKKSISEIIDNVKLISKLAVTVIHKFFKHLTIKIARIKMIIATEDAATTAVAYGAITQSLNILLPALESVKNFKDLKNAEIEIEPSFLDSSPTVDIKIAFSIRVWHVFDAAFSALRTFLKHKFNSDVQPQKSENPQHKFNNKNKDK